MAKTFPISIVRARLSELVSDLTRAGHEIVITRNGKREAVIVNYAQYRGLKDTLDVLADENLMKQIRASERYLARGGKGITFERAFGQSKASTPKRSR